MKKRLQILQLWLHLEKITMCFKDQQRILSKFLILFISYSFSTFEQTYATHVKSFNSIQLYSEYKYIHNTFLAWGLTNFWNTLDVFYSWILWCVLFLCLSFTAQATTGDEFCQSQLTVIQSAGVELLQLFLRRDPSFSCTCFMSRENNHWTF